MRVMGHLWGTLGSMIQAVYNLYILNFRELGNGNLDVEYLEAILFFC